MKNQEGQAFALMIVVTAIVLLTTLLLIGGAQLYYQNSSYSIKAEKAIGLAEAGVDKAVASLNKTGGSYNGETETTLGGGTYSIKIITQDASTKIIESTGFIPNKTKPIAKRTVKIQTSKGIGVAFVYGIQVGDGGLQLGKHNSISGTIYSNGNITSDDDNRVTGDAWVAGGPQPNPDQSTDCSGANCADFLFGKTVDSDKRLDLAQSFTPGSSGVLNKATIKIKKYGNPSDLTVRILGDSDGQPDKNTVLTMGTLYSSLVTSSYGWIEITFNSSPNLTEDTPYWLMVDTSSDNNNYWSWQNDLAQSYNGGLPKWSPDWNTGNPTWNSTAGDLSFKTYLGGAPTSIRAQKSLQVDGSVYANTIEKLTIGQDAYYQTITASSVGGSQHPGANDPPPKVFPISDANVAEWKDIADGVDGTNVQTGDITNCLSTLGPKKIEGSIIFDNSKSCTVTITSPVWVTGNVDLHNSNIFKLPDSYGSSSGVIVVDGSVTLDNNNKFYGSGVGSSILMVLSEYDSRSNGISAIQIKNNGNTGVFYASAGIIEPGNNNTFKELTAWGIKLVNNSTIDYETGLSSTLFSSGPSGSFSLVKGTYQVK